MAAAESPAQRLEASSEGSDEVLHGAALEACVRETVETTPAIDVHTHLFPAQHGDFLLWGVDEMLTYHYLVSEFFMVAPAELTYDAFFAWPKSKQADMIWETLFIDRSPISEAQIGVITALSRLGLGKLLASRQLQPIREWFASQDPLKHTDRVFEVANLRYVVMTNVPFDEREASCWVKPGAKIDCKSSCFVEGDGDILPQSFCATRFKAALRIDPLLKGDWGTIAACLAARGLPETLDGARAFLRAWAKVYHAEYLMASTPADFLYGEADAARQQGWPTATQLIDEVMVPVAEELALPLVLKLGAKRGMNPRLNPCGGGDGVCVSDVGPLEELCRRCPQVKFLATFLSRVSQHEVCVLAQKFRNLHIYGCWWYLNNPSIIDEMTSMRLEMLGTAFTAQHSDARVLDQLVYKWSHSRRVIARALARQYALLDAAGWPITRGQVAVDVRRLFGESYEDFMAKDLSAVATAAVAAQVPDSVPPVPPVAKVRPTRPAKNFGAPAKRDFIRFCAPGLDGCGCC